jgi:hypothetical protein
VVGDGVPPPVQIFEVSMPALVSSAEGVHVAPEGHPEPPEVGPKVPGIRIALIELATLSENEPERFAHSCRRSIRGEEINGLGMETPAKPLELRRQQYGVRVVDLQGGVPTPSTRPSDGFVRRFNLIECALCVTDPRTIRGGGHSQMAGNVGHGSI